MQWGLITCANHPIFQYLIDLIVNEIKEVRFLKRTDLHNTTGPTMFTRAIVDTHCLSRASGRLYLPVVLSEQA
jgi:hypothetical protein